MNFFSLSRSVSEQEKLNNVAIASLDLRSKISVLMARSQLQMAYTEMPRKRPFTRRGVALAWLADFSLPPAGRRQNEEHFAVTADNRIGRACKLGNDLISLRFLESPLPLDSVYEQPLDRDGMTLGELLDQDVDARLLAIGIDIKRSRSEERIASLGAISVTQSPQQIDIPPVGLAA